MRMSQARKPKANRLSGSWLTCPDDSTFHVSSTYATCMIAGDVWFNDEMTTACSAITQYFANGKSQIWYVQSQAFQH